MAEITDRFGRPISPQRLELMKEVARPDVVGVRQVWDARSAVVGLTPDRLDYVLRQANQGDLSSLLTLAMEMEERDPHYAAVLQTRKLAVVGLDRKVTWADGKPADARADEIQEACAELVDAPAMDQLILGLLDSIAKPYAVVETIWHTGKDRWSPVAYEYRDPRWFQLDRRTGAELRLMSDAPNGSELPPYAFSTQIAGNKAGLVARRGLARVVAFSFVCKLYGLKDWMAYAEIFGIPLRLGKYGAGATPQDVEVLKQAVFGLGSDAAAVIPDAMTIEFPLATSGAGNAELFEKLVVFMDDQVSKAVLGQTGTTDMQAGGGYAQAVVHDRVRDDLTRADAKSVGATISRDVFTPFVAFNWGVNAPVPRAELVVRDPVDLVALADTLAKVVPLGLRVSHAEILRKLGLSEPADDEDVLRPPSA